MSHGYLWTSLESRVFHQIGGFSTKWSYIENGFARLSNHDKDNEGNEKIQKAKLMSKQNFEHAVHFLADFFAVIERLTWSNFIGVAMRSSNL